MPLVRTRLALALVSAVTIAMELALMRTLGLRFWHHFAYMVISVALLGFAASGTALSLLRRRAAANRTAWASGLATGLAVAGPACVLLAHRVDLDVPMLAWEFGQVWNVLAIELLLMVPFMLAGGVIAVALTDAPERLSGHYAANLAGSGIGAVLGVAMLYPLSPSVALVVLAWGAWLAGLILLPRWRPRAVVVNLLAGAVLAGLSVPASRPPPISPYKVLPQVLAMKNARTLVRAEGPLGRIDVVEAAGLHTGPGLSLQWQQPLPPQVLLVVDGDHADAVYDAPDRAAWEFTDYTTDAAAWAVRPDARRICILGAGGGEPVGLAVYHRAERIVAVQANPQVTEVMTRDLAGRGGEILKRPDITVVNREVRGFLLGGGERFDLIHVPGGTSAAGASLASASENYLYTVESFRAMVDRLGDDGVLCIGCPADAPPRQGLRIFDTAVQAVRAGSDDENADPAARVAMLRSWSTVTVLVARRPWTPDRLARLRAFAAARNFDLCYLPGLRAEEANRYHQLPQPYYFQAAQELLSDRRAAFLNDYLFDVSACTDDRPYFFDFLRWRSIPALQRQLGRTSRAFLESGTVMLTAAIVQAAVAAVVLVLLPLAPGALRRGLSIAPPGRAGLAGAFVYFTLIGLAFMTLEMGFLQKLILYLADPIYSAAVVIAAFLLFAGVGSMLSGRWGNGEIRNPNSEFRNKSEIRNLKSKTQPSDPQARLS